MNIAHYANLKRYNRSMKKKVFYNLLQISAYKLVWASLIELIFHWWRNKLMFYISLSGQY